MHSPFPADWIPLVFLALLQVPSGLYGHRGLKLYEPLGPAFRSLGEAAEHMQSPPGKASGLEVASFV